MNWENPYQEPSRFSFGWCVGVTILHFVVSIVFPFLAFGAAMNAFSPQHGDIKAQVSTIELFSWIWMAGPMLLARVGGVSFEKGLLFYMFVYSALIGVAAGYLAPWKRRR